MPTLFKRFFLTATKANGEGLEGVRVRVFDSANVEKTSALFGVPEFFTNAYGGAIANFIVDPLGAGVYSIQLSKVGFLSRTIQTEATFTGAGTFQVPLEVGNSQSASGFEVIVPALYASPLAPIVYEVANENPLPGERIIAKVTHSDGRVSKMSANLDARTGNAYLDIHSKIRLHPKAVFVPDGQKTIEDLNFSDKVTVELSTSTTGEIISPQAEEGNNFFEVFVANALPRVPENDLSEFVETEARWLNPFEEPVLFRGYYLDVAFWCPRFDYEQLSIRQAALGSTKNLLDAEAIYLIERSDYVQRFRVEVEHTPFVKWIRVQIFSGSEAVSKTLMIRYRG